MDTGPAHRGSLQLHRIKHCHRIDQPCPGSAPLNVVQPCLPDLVLPLKRNGIARKLRSPSQGFPVSNIIIGKHQTIGRNVIALHRVRKFLLRLRQALCGYFRKCHNLKSLFPQPFKLSPPGVVKIHPIRPHKGKCLEMHVPLSRELAVELAHGAAAQIPGILVFCIHVLDFLIDPAKIRISDHSLSP